ncbi:class I adenylate-forming enzyme family protein [Ruixingdingia sedimenti]|uniref:AMP-binding protein n=1 Tax=Ruixingdingia sedimenti TaxID=3073604 RepID=A0ABU1F7F7_9RHOB|nr:AMP-binding protein [Xinfangfangia sp. LG-4]MDR5652815.1 AMP-binding protein [Xinfangfangia sp. LG-4]
MFDHVPDMAARRADLGPDALALRDHDSGRDWTFAAINAAANGMAEGLRAQGLAEGDRIAILCQNRVEFFVALFACQKTGIILCPLNWRQPAPELVDVLEPFAPRALLYEDAFADTAATVAGSLALPAWRLEGEAAGWMAAGGPGSAGAIPAGRVWYLLFTSGTTGRPKAVIQTARMAWANAVNIGQAIGLTGADRSVNFLPLFHTAGINLYTLPVFLTGGSSTVLRKFDAGAALDLIRSGAVTQFFGVPAIYQALSLLAEVDGVDWSRLRCGCGGAPLPEPLIRFFAARGCKVLNGFGMTETGPTVFLMDAAHAETKIGSVGRPQVLTECRLDGVPDGQPGTGEVLFRGPNITPGYYGNPEATAAAFDPDGWLRSGDVGRRDADGFVWVVDRIKDMYISGGENVYPAEVERVLNEHADVLEAAVVGVPDAKWGEVGAAFVIPRPGARVDAAALRAWCRERLAAYKVPATVRAVDDLPRTAAGKVRKPDLRLWAQRGE